MFSSNRTLRYMHKSDRKAARIKRAATPVGEVTPATLEHAPITSLPLTICAVCAVAKSIKLTGRNGQAYATCDAHNPRTKQDTPARAPIASYTVARRYVNRGMVERYA